MLGHPSTNAGKVLPKHLLWTLYHLKLYNSEDASSATFQTNRVTYRKWVKIVPEIINGLDLVSHKLHTRFFFHL
jgi:hypothetical protein